MRVQGGSTAAVGPVGALPVPVPLREDTAFAAVLDRTGSRATGRRASVYGPLALAQTRPATLDAPAAVPRLDAIRAYARVPTGSGTGRPGKAVSLRV